MLNFNLEADDLRDWGITELKTELRKIRQDALNGYPDYEAQDEVEDELKSRGVSYN